MDNSSKVVKLAPPVMFELDRPANKGERWSPEARTQAVAYALERMTDGASLDASCREMDINPGTVLGWINADGEAENRYECLKIVRSRAFMERAIDEMQQNPDYKAGESRARTYMRLAALLNPKEFSDRLHSGLAKSGPGQRVTFVLNMPHAPEQDKGVIECIVQPQDGELS